MVSIRSIRKSLRWADRVARWPCSRPNLGSSGHGFVALGPIFLLRVWLTLCILTEQFDYFFLQWMHLATLSNKICNVSRLALILERCALFHVHFLASLINTLLMDALLLPDNIFIVVLGDSHVHSLQRDSATLILQAIRHKLSPPRFRERSLLSSSSVSHPRTLGAHTTLMCIITCAACLSARRCAHVWAQFGRVRRNPQSRVRVRVHNLWRVSTVQVGKRCLSAILRHRGGGGKAPGWLCLALVAYYSEQLFASCSQTYTNRRPESKWACS